LSIGFALLSSYRYMGFGLPVYTHRPQKMLCDTSRHWQPREHMQTPGKGTGNIFYARPRQSHLPSYSASADTFISSMQLSSTASFARITKSIRSPKFYCYLMPAV